MIDAHLHVVRPNLPGVGALSPLLDRESSDVALALRREMETVGAKAALAMGCCGGNDDDPLGIAGTLSIAREVPGLHAVGVADPRRTDAAHLRRAEAALATGRVRALKAYLGYLHFGPDDPGYRPYYEMAERHQIPVIFHTGDTYSPSAKLRYARPLAVDDIAVDHPAVRFVLAHMGNPWLTDAAEVVYKNINVWADLSGLTVGDAASFASEALQEVQMDVRRAFLYADRPNRFLYGSDWPLVPMKAYREFVAGAVPEIYHPQVFEENARTLFRV
jgi:predicted TIM-barrel fold metal-dependent hydrolase